MVFVKNGRSEVYCQRVVDTHEGKFKVSSNWEPFGERRGPLVLLIPKETVQHIQKHSSIWKRVTVRV